jgi:flagellar biogenesis protein FliO
MSIFITMMMLGQSSALHAQGLGQSQEGVSMIRVFVSLAVCLTVALAATLYLRFRMNTVQVSAWRSIVERVSKGGTAPRRLQILEAVSLGAHRICVIRCDEAEWLVSASTQEVTILTSLPTQTPSKSADQEA